MYKIRLNDVCGFHKFDSYHIYFNEDHSMVAVSAMSIKVEAWKYVQMNIFPAQQMAAEILMISIFVRRNKGK